MRQRLAETARQRGSRCERPRALGGRQPLYVAAWGSQSFFRVSRGEKPPAREEVPLGFRVDNIRWARDGTLFAVGQAGERPSL